MANYKGYKHLTLDKRYKIEALHTAGHTPGEIAKAIGCCRATIYNELKRATYIHHSGDFWKEEVRYAPERAEEEYRKHLKEKGRGLKIKKDMKLAERIEEIIIDKKYSPAAALMLIKQSGESFDVEIKSVTTIYNYIKRGDVFDNLQMQDCPYRKKAKTRKSIKRAKRATKGRSIEDRPKEIDTREEFGHWEMDTVKGRKKNKKTLLVLTERKTRHEIMEPLKSNTTEETRKALNRIEKQFKSDFFKIFKTITVDNGVEFSDCDSMKKALYRVGKRTDIYYCHPYCSSERGSNENQNRLIRRHLPKGADFDKVVNKNLVKEVEDWINNYPRAMFDGKSSEMMFIEEYQKLKAG